MSNISSSNSLELDISLLPNLYDTVGVAITLIVQLFSQPLCGALHQRIGGGERDRTDDLLLAKQALSQLSYTPSL